VQAREPTDPAVELPAPPVDADGVLDFTVERKPLRFRVDADVFEAIPALPTLLAFELQGIADRIRSAPDSDARRAALLEVFGSILLPSSLERFVERLGSVTEPIDPTQLIGIVQGLVGTYARRPTPPSQGSSPASAAPAPGTPSTDGFPWPASMPGGFPSGGSAT
jgi:hypothetical protein